VKNSSKYNQQDAKLYSILYYCQRCTSFGRFIRPSSGAQELYTQHLVCTRAAIASVVELELNQSSDSSKQAAATFFLAHEEKYLILIELLTLNSNV